MKKKKTTISDEINKLRVTLNTLREPGGCPWDREQSIDDLASYLIDEAYELQSAVKSKIASKIEEELGDTLYILIFIHLLHNRNRKVTLREIIHRVHRKIIDRHPHVFGSSSANSTRESLAHWERVKRKERKGRSQMDSLPEKLPPLRKAAAIQRKAANIGFDWENYEGVINKLYEEIEELKTAIESGKKKKITEELGDIFFTVTNLSGRLNIDPELSITEAADKFTERFKIMELLSEDKGIELSNLDIDQLEDLWRKSKKLI
ncbi:MAG TPA: nucleoside triphosphate pyrophosphohydrolase [Candidatus Krumholzibacteriaceae bacterium]|nr:nucleoside triphosphate pyrophosphohydrolase [Candidatus Krumholzibacteriaceae bacterium]